jgi:hypothetical protein
MLFALGIPLQALEIHASANGAVPYIFHLRENEERINVKNLLLIQIVCISLVVLYDMYGFD